MNADSYAPSPLDKGGSSTKPQGIHALATKLASYLRSRYSNYKSQKGQDRWVLDLLRFKKRGFFVDLAASDGVIHNNTWVLEKKYDWDGILIEPNPVFFRKLVRARHVTALDCVVDTHEGVVPFRIDNGGLGGIVADDTDNNPCVRGDQLPKAEIVDLKAKTLTRILDDVGAPSEIDYLSLDVEGAEERVVQGLDLQRYTFYCMTIERPNRIVNELLFDHGYRFVKNYNFDTFYIHKNHPFAEFVDCQPFEPVPPKDR